jgi:hypothetical protein
MQKDVKNRRNELKDLLQTKELAVFGAKNELVFECQRTQNEPKKQGTGNREQGTGNREQGTGNREQGTGNREQDIVGYKDGERR